MRHLHAIGQMTLCVIGGNLYPRPWAIGWAWAVALLCWTTAVVWAYVEGRLTK